MKNSVKKPKIKKRTRQKIKKVENPHIPFPPDSAAIDGHPDIDSTIGVVGETLFALLVMEEPFDIDIPSECGFGSCRYPDIRGPTVYLHLIHDSEFFLG